MLHAKFGADKSPRRSLKVRFSSFEILQMEVTMKVGVAYTTQFS